MSIAGYIDGESLPQVRRGRIEIIDALRGLAALAVCWHHFTNGTGEFLSRGWLRASGKPLWLGVEIFFVISGFIIPHALVCSGYSIRSSGRFIIKRLLRLDPPYFASIALVLAVGFLKMMLTNTHKGNLPYDSFTQIGLHFGYLSGIFGYEWLNPIYWTLAIEFQFYVAMAFLFPLIFQKGTAISWAVCSLLCAASLLPSRGHLLFSYLPWFLVGVVCCLLYHGRIQQWQYICAVAILGVVSWYRDGVVVSGVVLGTGFLITAWRGRVWRPLSYIGLISYSLYLVHGPVGCTFIDLSLHFQPGEGAKPVILIIALVISLLAAWLMYILVEKPSARIAQLVVYEQNGSLRSFQSELPNFTQARS